MEKGQFFNRSQPFAPTSVSQFQRLSSQRCAGFHNGDFGEEDQQQHKSSYGASLKFHTLEKGGPYWSLPPAAGLQESDFKKWRVANLFSLGYRHMMRWYGILICKYLADHGYDWYMRLDDDSKLLSCINYDLFQFMRDNHLAYGYRQLAFDSPGDTQGLFEMAREHIREHKHEIPPENREFTRFLSKKWRKQKKILFARELMGPYNNFLISKLSFWTSPEVQAWLRDVDSSGIQYKYRVSDLPVQAVTLEMLMPAQQVHQFTDFAYSHFTLSSSNTYIFGALSWPAKNWTEDVYKYIPQGSSKLQ
eukprot:gnl/TRDRNA2_/TRDRNA2_172598_c0_seq1.p1 gnl/TRDRNA2_/TRDRNA2_172598_c0~~gnl/TRDRNA2_/TRDRNA2_172598_c0_seq1.p1  ORF type:complete len:305 (+),score=35.40 gnl/TRDRNA2_/TRDRNA2_172598_c0_seq1:152-1066(+)